MDIYAAVTERIIEQMEQGIIPWQKPWISTEQHAPMTEWRHCLLMFLTLESSIV